MALPDGLRVAAVGDVFLDRDEPEHAFRHAQAVFRDFDAVFGNLEGVYSRDWHRAPSAGVPLVTDPKFVSHLAGAGLNVLSLANNHSVDGGFEALLHTREAIRGVGIATAGAGADITDARHPALVETPHGRVAVLAYASVFPHGYEARPGWPGLAPMRAYTHYEPWETNEWNPGLQPKVFTVAHEGDQRALHDDVAAATQQADLVLASFHWGDFTRPYVLTDHERRTARVAIDGPRRSPARIADVRWQIRPRGRCAPRPPTVTINRTGVGLLSRSALPAATPGVPVLRSGAVCSLSTRGSGRGGGRSSSETRGRPRRSH